LSTAAAAAAAAAATAALVGLADVPVFPVLGVRDAQFQFLLGVDQAEDGSGVRAGASVAAAVVKKPGEIYGKVLSEEKYEL